MNNWEHSYLNLIHKNYNGPTFAILRFILYLLSYIYRFAIFLRNWLYDKGIIPQKKLKKHVIVSIGNIVTGGTGKTPVTLHLAEKLKQHFPISILSRGYRTADEAKLLAQRLPDVNVIIGKDRYNSANQATHQGAKLILLDDGFQHRRLYRNYDIVVIDAREPFGLNYLLPRGLLREPKTSLKRSHLIIINHVLNRKHFEEITTKINKYTSVPIIGSQLKLLKIIDINGISINSINGKKVGIFCGIAKPKYFVDTVKKEQAEIVFSHFLPDHKAWNENEFLTFITQCKEAGAEMILCTEKDIVKINKQNYALPIFFLQMELKITEEYKLWETFTDNIIKEINLNFS